MAGTRFLLLSSYVIQFSTLSLLATYLTIKKSYKSNGSWRGSLPFIVDRQGVSTLRRYDFGDNSNKLEDIRDVVHRLQQEIDAEKIPVQFFLATLGEFNLMGGMPSAAKAMAISLEQALEERLQHSQDLSSSVQASVIPSPIEGNQKMAMEQSCDRLSLQALAMENMTTSVREDGYMIYIAHGCSDSHTDHRLGAVEIDDMGNMLLRLHKSVSTDDIERMISKDLAAIIYRNIFFNMASIDITDTLQASSSFKFVVSLVDSDPLSYQLRDNIWSARDHNDELIDALSTAIENKFAPTIEERLMQFIDVQLTTQTISYSGSSIFSESEMVEKDDGSIVYAVNEGKAKELLLNEDLSSLSISHDETDSNTHHFLALAPARYYSPLVIRSETSTGCAFYMPDKQYTVSIMNLSLCNGSILENDENRMTTEPSSNGVCQKELLPSIYSDAVTQSISHFGIFIRTFLGLPRQRPDRIDDTKNDAYDIAVNFILSSKFITQWEIDNLVRKVWKRKAIKAAELLETTLKLIAERQGVAFPVEAAYKLIESIAHLRNALSMSRDLKRSNTMMIEINKSYKLAKSLVSDSTITELPYFPSDQVFGVFGSLYIPLTLPFFVGLIREWKRYKQLTKT